MKLTTREDIEAPIDYVFAQATDFDSFERQALRRGAEVYRTDALGVPGVGSEWKLRFSFRGSERNVAAKMVEFDAPNGFRAASEAGGLEGDVILDLMPLSPRQTRMQVTLDLRPRSLTGRLLIQSLKFAKNKITKRFSGRVSSFAQDIESRHRDVA